MAQMNDMMAAAAQYMADGWKIFPLKPNSKAPATKNGYKDATDDPQIIPDWWGGTNADRGIGLALAPSQLIAIDIDPRNGGIVTLAELEFEHGDLDRRCHQRTGRGDGGHHLVLRARAGVRYPASLGRGVDLKHNGYIVLAPSLHPDTGKPYQWERREAPAPAPDWLSAPREAAATAAAGGGEVTDGKWGEICAALAALDPDMPGHDWASIGLALKSTGRGAQALEAWEAWSEGGTKWREGECATRWGAMGGWVAGGVDYRMILKRGLTAGSQPHHLGAYVDPDEAQAALSPAAEPALAPAAEPIDGLVDEAEPARGAEAPIAFIDWGHWDGRAIPARRWLVQDRIGMDHVTGLYGRGGIGKSRLTQQLALCVAGGREFLDTPTMHGRMLGLYCEDDERELVERQSGMASAMGVRLKDLQHRFLAQARVGRHNVLLTANPQTGRIEPSRFYRWIEEEVNNGVKSGDPVLGLVLDNIAQMMSLNENDRVQVTQAMNLVSALAVDYQLAVLLLGHPAKSQESVQSGSSAWTNVMRSMLYLGKGKDDVTGAEKRGDQKGLVLSQEKGNYSSVPNIELTFQGGMYQRTDTGPMAREIQEMHAARLGAAFTILTTGLQECLDVGLRPSASRTSPGRFLPRLLADMGKLGTCTEEELAGALPHAMSSGLIISKGEKDKRHSRDMVWIEPSEKVLHGGAQNGGARP